MTMSKYRFVGLTLLPFVVLSLFLFHQRLDYNSLASSSKSCPSSTRGQRVREACQRLGLDESVEVKKLYRFLAVDEQKIVYCHLPKVASTSFKRLLVQNTASIRNGSIDRNLHFGDRLESIGIRKLDSYPPDDIDYRVQNYLKFVVVRHPFDRLLSAYNDKFRNARRETYLARYLEVITEHFDEEMKPKANSSLLFTVEQFLTLVAKEPNRFMDGHWRSFIDQCHPCMVGFDHIIRLETVDTDVSFVLEHLRRHSGQQAEITHRHHLRNKTHPFSEVNEVFRNLDSDVKTRLLDIYRNDFEVFGYTWSDDHGAGCSPESSDGTCC